MLDIDGGFRAGIVTPRTLATEDEGPKGMLPVTRALPARAESMDSKFFGGEAEMAPRSGAFGSRVEFSATARGK